jgi:hypothetical protein
MPPPFGNDQGVMPAMGQFGADMVMPDQEAPPPPPPPEPGEVYWAKKEAAELIGALKDKESKYFSSAERRGLKGMWEIAYAQYYGTDPMNPGDMATQTLARTGPKGKFTRFRINEVRSIIGQQNIIALGERPAFQCMAVNSDYESMAQVEICDSIVGYLYKKAMGEARERQVLEADGVWGAGFGHLRWDSELGDDVESDMPVPGAPPNDDGSPATVPVAQRSGAPYVTVCYPWEVVQDPEARELNWAIIRERRSKWELAAEWPEHAAAITKVNVLDEYAVEHMFGFAVSDASSDDCLVKHFYHPRCSALPEGRYVGICGDETLWDGPCPIGEGIPLAEICSSKYACSSFGYAGSWDLISIQEMLDQLCSDTASNLSTHGRNVLFYEKGTEFSFDKISEGLAAFGVSPGSQMPQMASFAQMPEATKWFMEYLHERHQSLSGLNSVARGDPKSNIKSGEMAALFHSIAIEFQSARQAALDGYRVRVANLMLDMVRNNADSPFLVEISGKDNRPYLQTFTSDTVRGVRRVELTTTSPMMRSQEGRMQVFTAIEKIPPQDRNAAYEFIVTGQIKGFTEKPMSSDLRIQWENEALQDGHVVPVLFCDNPWLHVPEHVAALEKLTASFGVSAEAIKAFSDHIVQHGVVYQGLDPRVAAFLGIPAPPPVPGSPAWQLQQDTGGGFQPLTPNDTSASGGPAPAAGPTGGGPGAQPPSKPQARDTTGTKIPNPSTPPAGAGLMQ